MIAHRIADKEANLVPALKINAAFLSAALYLVSASSPFRDGVHTCIEITMDFGCRAAILPDKSAPQESTNHENFSICSTNILCQTFTLLLKGRTEDIQRLETFKIDQFLGVGNHYVI